MSSNWKSDGVEVMTDTNEQTFAVKHISRDIVVINTGRTLDNDNAHEMVDAILSAQHGGVRFVIMNMADLEFLSSAGVGSILGTVETFRERDGDIILCNVLTGIRHVLEVLDLADFLVITDSEEEATIHCGLGK